MESAPSLRSFHCSSGSRSHVLSTSERRAMATCAITCKSHPQGLTLGKLSSSSSTRRVGVVISCAATPDLAASSTSDVSLNGGPKVSKERHAPRSATFPDAFEDLLTEVCDETSIAELKVKVGNYEMHIKRNIGTTNVVVPLSSPVVAPPIPSEPMDQSAPAELEPEPEPSPEKPNPFANAATPQSPKLSALEASGSSGFKLVTSPAVGFFYRGKMVKGKRQPPVCKEGGVVKEGQVIGYLAHLGKREMPVKSNVDGEVLKILVDDGGAAGYGDPLVAVLPSFHEIK